MKRKFLTLLLAFSALSLVTLKAQEFMPFYSSPYAGVTAAKLNPASLAGSKYKFDVTVFGASAGVHNDLYTLGRKHIMSNPKFYWKMFNDRNDVFDQLNGQESVRDYYVSEASPNWGNEDEYGGYSWTQLDVLNLMYSFTDRFAMSLGYSLRSLTKVNDIPELAAQQLTGYIGGPVNLRDGSIRSVQYNQISIGAAYTLVNKENHKFKIGATAKILFGGKSGFWGNGMAGLATKSQFAINKKAGLAGDIGIEYEYQPDELKGEEVAEYRLKIGASLIDAGRFTTKDTRYYGGITTTSVPNSYLQLIGNRTGGGDYSVWTPWVLTGQIDYNFGKGFFLNFTPYIALNQSHETKGASFTSFNLAPHYELKNFGVSVPLQYDQYGKFNAGLSLRAFRHIWIGSNTILKMPFTKKNYGTDVHVMVKIPILAENNDRDGDGVPDKKDRCPDVPGLKKYQGCPDTDGDGIPDDQDKCPNEPGPASTQGCPDRDGDGIIDSEDACPDEPGPASTRGCPDRDGDGIPDKDDACPDEAGPASTKGCPDRDGDGVPDKDDECPDQAGPASTKGCPDRDGDGVPDKDDKCPDEAGPASNQGCPEEKGIRNIEFEIDKFIIRPEFTPILDKVVDSLQANPNATVMIVGHTDNTYTRPYNMNLSKRRAEAVKRYLTKKKIASKRIQTQYYGPDRPIATNDTAEGRQQNRRAEITIVISDK